MGFTYSSIDFQHPWSFWTGTAALSVGVALHLPMYVNAREMHFHMAGMSPDTPMLVGMVLIVVGFALAAYGIIPRTRLDLGEVARLQVRTLDDAPIRASHVALLLVMAAAITIDVMKPTTLAFVMPGITEEYGLRSPLNPGGDVPVAWLPTVALFGMVLGSVTWGWLGDRIGRRASMLLAGLMFIGTSICGAMPGFHWNLLMCFLMGVAVGGMLPIAFALLAETIPARHRSWVMVLIGGDIAGAYLLTSFLASRLEPTYSWRILWLIGLPSGVMLILLNRWIPESPRFLLAAGRATEAAAVMRRFGARIVPDTTVEPATRGPGAASFWQLFRKPFTGLTAGIALFGLGWGMVNNGFLLWLPTNLRATGFDVRAADGLLAQAALVGFPVIFIVALLYGLWSSKWTMIIFASVTAATLIAFAVLSEQVADHPMLLLALVVVLLSSTAALLAMLTPYSSEVYPTHIRARGTGLSGMCARAGGFVGVGVVLAGLAPPSLTGAAILGAIPTGLAAMAIYRFGIETRKRRLEDITRAEMAEVTEVTAAEPLTTKGGDRAVQNRENHNENHVDYLLIGAGPGCVQLAYYLRRAEASYLVLESGEAPGTFFRQFPRHRTLISINKPHVGNIGPGPALRYDWNSLLSDDVSNRFVRYSGRYFPAADDMLRYLADFATKHQLNIRYNTVVQRVEKNGCFKVFDQDGRNYTARRLIVGTGMSAPYLPAIPGIEHTERYWDFATDPSGFTNKRVLVIGKGNAAFETAEGILETAETTHLCSPNPVRFAWKSRYVGHLRAVNNNFLDTYHLKSQNAVMDADITRIVPARGGYEVDFAYTHAAGERIRRFYDRIVTCTGFRFDDSIFAPEARPATCHGGRYPAQTTEWESTNVPGLFFVGTLMHARDYHRTMSGFVHGFRYNIRFLADLFQSKDTGGPLTHREIPSDADELTHVVLDRLNASSSLFLQPGYLCDVFAGPADDGVLRHHHGIPFEYAFHSELSRGTWLAVTLEYGPEAEDPFFIERDTDPAWARFAPFLHPVVRVFRDTTQVGQLHLLEDLENKYTTSRHGPPLRQFLAEHLTTAAGTARLGG